MSEPSIKTTVVGSYPLPTWLAAYPSVPNLRDAVLVVLKTQELAGLDVISDGELTRFDVNHPETNGMIEYFVRPMAGISSRMGRKDVADFRAQQGMGFRTQPAGVVEGPIDEGELDLPSSWQLVKELTATPAQVHRDRALYAGEDAAGPPLRRPAQPDHGHRRRPAPPGRGD